MPCVFRLQSVHLFDQGKARVPYQMQHGFCASCLSSVSHCHFLPCLKVVIFVKSVQRCVALSQLLVEQNFPAIAIHRGMAQEERWVLMEREKLGLGLGSHWEILIGQDCPRRLRPLLSVNR